MKKFFGTLFATVLGMSSAIAAEPFFKVDVQPGPFMVYGVPADYEKNMNPGCYAETTWRDGSDFQLIRDLSDGELYIWFRNISWSITDAPGNYIMRMNFSNSAGNITGLNFEYRLVNKNTIVIRNIKKEMFLPLFSNNSKVVFAMPGSIPNAEIGLLGSAKTLAEISNCVNASSSVNLFPQGPLNSNNSGGGRSQNWDNI